MPRVGAIAISAVLLAIVGAGTATAKTLVVDDDRAQCPAAPYRTIQSAVDAAAARDKVSVCPGSYRGQVYIPTGKPGLVVESAKRRAATILSPRQFLDPPPTLPPGLPPSQSKLRAIVVAAADRSVVRGFRISGPLAPVPPALCGGGLGFSHEAGVQVGGLSVRIEDNHIRDIRDNCGEGIGVWVGDAQDELQLNFAGARSVVRDNLIEQYRKIGVIVEAANEVKISDNEIIGAQSRPTTGVLTGQESAADVERNVIRSNRTAGIHLGSVFSTGFSSALDNTIRGNGIGIDINDEGVELVADNDISASRSHGIIDRSQYGGSRILRNNVRDSGGHGLLLQVDNGQAPLFPFGIVTGNIVRHSRDGIRVEGTNYRLSGNAASVSRGLDCRDTSGPGGSGTAGTFNTWTNNRGRTDSPAAICRP